jgi:hypothetical protein
MHAPYWTSYMKAEQVVFNKNLYQLKQRNTLSAFPNFTNDIWILNTEGTTKEIKKQLA